MNLYSFLQLKIWLEYETTKEDIPPIPTPYIVLERLPKINKTRFRNDENIQKIDSCRDL